MTGMNIVETFLTTQLPEQERTKQDYDGLSRTMNNGFKSGNLNTVKSQTQQKFLKYTND